MPDPNDTNLTHSECYVAAGRRWTVDNSTGGLWVYQGGDLVVVHNSEVEQAVQDGILLPPGQPYVAPAGYPGGMPPTNPNGITKRSRFAVAAELATYPVPAPTVPGKVITLPGTPTDAATLSVQVNSFTYLGPAIVAVVGANVTLSFTVLPTDSILATYR